MQIISASVAINSFQPISLLFKDKINQGLYNSKTLILKSFYLTLPSSCLSNNFPPTIINLK